MPPDPITTPRVTTSPKPPPPTSRDTLHDPLREPLVDPLAATGPDPLLSAPTAHLGLSPLDPEQRVWRKLSPEEAEEQRLLEMADPNGISPLLTPGEGQDGHTVWMGDDCYVYDLPMQDDLVDGDLLGPQATNFRSRAFAQSDPEQGVMVLTPDGRQLHLPANEHGMVELPESGFGFNTYNRDDVKVGGQPQPDQYGSPDLIARVMNIAADYTTAFPGDTLNVGDLSTDTGASPLLETGKERRHKSHHDGERVDLRYADGRGSLGPVSANQKKAVDVPRQQSMIDLASAWGMNRFNYGKSLSGKLSFPAKAQATPDAGIGGEHHNHLHMGKE